MSSTYIKIWKRYRAYRNNKSSDVKKQYNETLTYKKYTNMRYTKIHKYIHYIQL